MCYPQNFANNDHLQVFNNLFSIPDLFPVIASTKEKHLSLFIYPKMIFGFQLESRLLTICSVITNICLILILRAMLDMVIFAG